ncbi:MAG: hypothetical protein IT377_10765 [Polyangiaceae bacterium]|nr:hypothetical protein [Polyangiaceae bacterium]
MAEPRQSRLVDRLVLHEGPIEFATLAQRMISNRARYLILDLDRTLHLGRNMGELLGWELTALRAFGLDELARMEPERRTGRLLFDPSRFAGSLRYLWHGGAAWTKPGLYYLACGKLPAKNDWLRAWTYRRFGPEPVRAVQRIPQDTLFRLMAGVPEATLRLLAERIWDRHEPDQVISADDLTSLRARCPGLEVVITSASPQVVVEVARARLGADHAEGSAPGRINTGLEKIARLRARFPDALRPGVEAVGITDTGYGEDHCWADHLARVADVNSDSPFSPFVCASSPIESVHSALLLTNAERRRRDAGHPHWIDRRRPTPARAERRVLTSADLAAALGEMAATLAALEREPTADAWPRARLIRDARRALELGPTPGTLSRPRRLAITPSSARELT